MKNELIGIGLYSLSEAKRLTGVPVPTIKRWIKGYKYTDAEGNDSFSKAIWHSELADFEEETTLTFKDLVEVKLVYAFKQHGLTLQKIRKAAEILSEEFHTNYPFAHKKLFTDGKNLLLGDSEELFDIVTNQLNIHDIVEQSFVDSIEFIHDEASKWYPLFPDETIVIDPARSFGKPITNKEGISTEILYKTYKVEEDKKLVSSMYNIPVKTLNKVIEFEEKLAA